MFDRLLTTWDEALTIWGSGGWAMYPLAAIALVMFGLGMQVLVRLGARRLGRVPERIWRVWIDHPAERRGPIGALLDFALDDPSLRDVDMAGRFDQLRARETARFERDLRVMKVAVGAATLVGLLGTVTGMLDTFGALGTGSGGDQTMAKVAGGISEALITTETGLVLALPGLFFQHQLSRQLDAYRAFLAHLETVCAQTIHRRAGRERGEEQRRAAARRIADALRHGLQAQDPREQRGQPGQPGQQGQPA